MSRRVDANGVIDLVALGSDARRSAETCAGVRATRQQRNRRHSAGRRRSPRFAASTARCCSSMPRRRLAACRSALLISTQPISSSPATRSAARRALARSCSRLARRLPSTASAAAKNAAAGLVRRTRRHRWFRRRDRRADAEDRDGEAMRLAALRDRFEAGLPRDAVVFGAGAPRLPNTSNFALPGITAETAVIAMDLEGVAVSSGAACSSGKVRSSRVLAAMGVAPDLAKAALRVSFGYASKNADVDAALAALDKDRDTPRARRSGMMAAVKETVDRRHARWRPRSTSTASSPILSRSFAPPGSPKRRCASSRPRRTSRSGCWIGAWARSSAG